MKIDDIPIIVHTCDSYSQHWDNWWYFTKKYCKHDNIIFASENLDPSFKEFVGQFKTGIGEWGERLIKILNSVNTEYIFYMQEDFWPIKDFPYNQKIIDKFVDEKINCWRICENSIFYSLETVESNTFKYKQNSLYTLSHQFSLWDVSFLKKYIEPYENPWDNEVYGSQRINSQESKHKIYFQEDPWYKEVVRKGTLTSVGKELLISENMTI